VSLKAVLLDLDDTLWRSNGASQDNEVMLSVQVEQTRDLFEAWGIASGDARTFISEFWQHVLDKGRQHLLTDSSFTEPDNIENAKAFLAGHGVDSDPAAVRLWLDTLYVPMVHRVNLEPYEDTIEVLHAVKASGLKTGVVTNRWLYGMRVLEDLAYFGLDDLIDVLVSSEEVGFRKPHPLIFQIAMERLAVQPDETVMVGDSYEADILGARAAGIDAILKLNGREVLPEWENERRINDLAELLALLGHS
jgi:putative hydrolase of the HAD superfamily